MTANLFERFRAGAVAAAPFMRTPDGGAVSYGGMIARSGQYANALLDLGVEPGDRVVVQTDKSAELVLLYLGCLRVGAVFVPLNSAYTLAEMEHFVQDSGPRVVVCAPGKLAALLPLARRLRVAHVVTLAADGQGGSLAERADAQDTLCFEITHAEGDLAALIYTSGTTGRAKGAMLTHANLAANAYSLKACWRYTAGDVLLHFLPLFHIHGLFVAINVTLAAGASLVLLPAFNRDTVLAQLLTVTVLMGVPTHYLRLLQDPRIGRASTARLRLCISGSAPLLAETHAEWRARTGHAIVERYGMTETGIVTTNPYDGERRAGTVGLPLPGVSVRVVDLDSGAAVASETVGMIEVKGPGVFSGYWRMPDRTRAEFRDDGYFVTGDLGRLDARGYLHIVGRGKDLIITGGYNVYPREIETAIDALPEVLESAVFGVPHPDFGEGVCALVVPRAADDRARQPALTESVILARLHERLAGYKCPKRVLFCAELPRNAMGKVQKNLLRDRYANLYRA
jgi:malonyl-CoA/methylmalonyl-CoA synthetase